MVRSSAISAPAANFSTALRTAITRSSAVSESGMLARLVRFTLTPVGFFPTQIDYSDYRDVAGVTMAFKKVVSQNYMQMTVELSEVQPNTTIDAARFAQPRP